MPTKYGVQRSNLRLIHPRLIRWEIIDCSVPERISALQIEIVSTSQK